MPQYPVTIAGNLTNTPRFKTTPTGHSICEIRIAASRSIRDENEPSGWRDIDHLFINCELWGQLAENTAASLEKGMAVVATGRLVTQEWEEASADTGENKKVKRQKILLKVDRLGLDLSKYVASSRRTDVAQHQVEGIEVPEIPTGEALAQKFQNADAGAAASGETRQESPQLAGVGAGSGEAPY